MPMRISSSIGRRFIILGRRLFTVILGAKDSLSNSTGSEHTSPGIGVSNLTRRTASTAPTTSTTVPTTSTTAPTTDSTLNSTDSEHTSPGIGVSNLIRRTT
eukprot:evm.model.NODE_25133_length_6284_cov_89.921707.1